jgi:hypothetical protein
MLKMDGSGRHVESQGVNWGGPQPRETAEWMEALDQIVDQSGPERASYLLDRLLERARRSGVVFPQSLHTPYVNTIPVGEEEPYPGDRDLERKIKSFIRWNAMAMVGTSRPTPRWPRWSKSASITFSAHRTKTSPAT